MDYRTGTRLIRALVEGVSAFVDEAKRAPDFDPGAFATFARTQNVREWITPVLADDRARALLEAPFLADLEAVRDAQPGHKQALLELSEGIRDEYAAASIPCLFLKGLCLAARFYGDIRRRHQYDVDVLVRPEDFAKAVERLGALGFDTQTEQVARRVREIGSRSAKRAPQTITVRREDGLEVDLHCRTKSRTFPQIDEEAFFAERQPCVVGQLELETLSDEHTLILLLVSIAVDLRRAKSRAKHFLDLYLVVRALDESVDWDRFLADRERDGLLTVTATVLAVFLSLWECASELPKLARAVAARRARIKLRNATEPLQLVTRPRDNFANRAWFLAVQGPTTLDEWRRALTVHLPHVVVRALRPRGGIGALWSEASAPTALPAELSQLLEREGLETRRVEPITTLPGGASPRRAYRIELTDGRVVKGRVTRAEVIARMRRFSPLLPAESFPPLLATSETAAVEAWDPGRPLAAPDDAAFEQAGAILGRLHGVVRPETVSVGEERLHAFYAALDDWVEALRLAGHLADGEAAETRALERPARATWGLVHGDFCLENLVGSDERLVCVDNPTVAEDILELDLAQTFYRWPMSTAERAQFLRGYERHQRAQTFLDHEAFWMVAAALRAAEFRMREETGAIDVPMRLLRAHVS